MKDLVTLAALPGREASLRGWVCMEAKTSSLDSQQVLLQVLATVLTFAEYLSVWVAIDMS